MRRRPVLFALAAVLTVLPACAGGPAGGSDARLGDTSDMAEIERLAREEGEVVWYTGALPATSQAVIDAFQQRYGVTVSFPGRMSSSEMGTRIQADVRNTGLAQADVLGPTPDLELFQYLRSEDVSERLPAAVHEGVPATYVDGDAAVTCQIQVPVIGYNTALLGDFAPTSWRDLLDPRLVGRIMVADPRGTVAWQRVWSVVLNDPGLGEEYIRGIAAQSFQPVANSLVGTEQLVAGQGAVQVAGIPSQFEPPMRSGKPIAFWVPENPAVIAPNFCALARGTPHPNAAFLFLHWLLSQEGQTVLNGVERSASPLGDVPRAFPLPPDPASTVSPQQLKSELPVLSALLGFN